MIAKQSRAFPASCSVTGSFDQQERKEGEGDRARERKRSRQTHAVPSEMQQHAPYLGARCLRWSLHLTRQSCERERERASEYRGTKRTVLSSLACVTRVIIQGNKEQGSRTRVPSACQFVQECRPLSLPLFVWEPGMIADQHETDRERERERQPT